MGLTRGPVHNTEDPGEKVGALEIYIFFSFVKDRSHSLVWGPAAGFSAIGLKFYLVFSQAAFLLP